MKDQLKIERLEISEHYQSTEEEEDYYKLKPKRINNFWNNNYIECESNGDKNRDSSLGEYLDKIKNLLEEYYYFSSKF